LVGLALLLSVAGFLSYAMRGVSLREGWRAFTRSGWTCLGVVFFCAGMALTSASGLEMTDWALMSIGALYLWWTARRNTPAITTPMWQASEGEAARVRTMPSGIYRVAEWLVRTELLWLALLAPFFVYPAPERLFALLGLPLLWVARRLARGRFLPRTPLDWPIVLMLVMLLVSLYATFDVGFSLPKITGLLYGIGLYYALVEWASARGRVRWAFGAFAFAGACLAVVALLGTNWTNKLPIVTSIASRIPPLLRGFPGAERGLHPNEMGGALLWVVPLQLALVAWAWLLGAGWRRTNWLQRVGLLTSLLISGFALLLTESRGALVGFALGCLLLLTLLIPRGRLLVAGLLVLALGAVSYAGPDNITEVLVGSYGQGFSPVDVMRSAQGRMEIWSRALYGIEDFSFTGMGMNTFRRVMPVLYPSSSFGTDRDLVHAHDHLLQVALDLGLPGLVAYMSIWLLAGRLVVLAYRRAATGGHRVRAAGVAASLLAYFVYGLTDAVPLGDTAGLFFWGLLGLSVALWKRTKVRQRTSAL
jgi:putative inorganic carbon (HCO3(-)) transporter